MKNFILFTLLAIMSQTAFGQFYWGSSGGSGAAINLVSQICGDAGTGDQKCIIQGTGNPSSVAVNAPQGSVYISTTNGMFQKQDNGLTTNWLGLQIGLVDLTTDVTGILPEANGGTGANLSAVAAGSLFYQSGVGTMGQLTGYAVNTYNGINAIHSKSVVDPGAPSTDTQYSYQLNTDVTTAGGNLNQNLLNYSVNYGGTEDLASLNNAFFSTNTSGAATVNSVTGVGYTISAGDGTNAGTANSIDGLYGNVTINNNYTVPTVRVMNIGANVSSSASVDDFSGQVLNLLIDGPVNNSFVLFNGGVGFGASATLNNSTMFNSNPTFGAAVSGNSTGYNFSPTHNDTSNGTFSFYSNPQFNDTASGMIGVYIGGNGTNAPGNYDGLEVQSNFAGTGTNANAANLSINHDVTGNVNGLSFSASGDAQNINGLNFNIQGNTTSSTFGSNIGITGDTTGNMYGENITISGDADNAWGSNISLNGAYSSSVTGMRIDVSGATPPTGTEAVALEVQGGIVNINSSVEIADGGIFKQGNGINTVATVPAGAARSSDFIGSNMPILLNALDDHTPGGFGLGISADGYVSVPTVAAGKTVAKLTNAVSAFNDASSGAGSVITDSASFRSLGALSTGGSATFTNVSHFKAETNPAPVGTNIFGVNIEDPVAENYFSKSIVIGGAAFNQVSNSDVALEVASLKAILPPRLTTAQKNALTPIEGMELYDTDLGAPQYYDGASWVTAGAGTGVSAIGVIDSQAKSANGAVVSGTDLVLQTADGTFPGLVSVAAQSFAGLKTFVNGIIDSTLTAGRNAFVGASGRLVDDADWLFNTTGNVVTLTNGQMNVDNLRQDGNTISSTDTNGNVQIDPDGTGVLDVVGSIVSSALTSGRCLFAGASGLITDDAGCTYNSATNDLTLTGTVTGNTVSAIGQVTANEVIAGRLEATSTTDASAPCNPVTTTQRNAMTPNAGECAYDTDLKTTFFYDGTNWAIQGVQPAIDTEALEYRASLSDGTAGLRFTVASFTTTGTSYVTPTDDSGNSRTNFVNGPKPVWVSMAFQATVLSNSTTVSVIRSTGTTTIMNSDSNNASQASVFVSAPFRLEANESFYLSTNNAVATSTPYLLVKVETIGSVGTYSVASSGASQIKWPAGTSLCAASGSSATFADMVDTDCSFAAAQKQGPVATPTTTGGIALKRSTAIAPGKYKVGFTGMLVANVGTSCAFQLTDGTNTIGPVYIDGPTATVLDNIPGIPASIVTYSSSTTPEWKLQAKRISGASVCEAVASDVNSSMAIHMEPIDEVITASLANTPQFPNSTQVTPVSFISTVDCDAGSTLTNETFNGTPTIGNISSGACVITLPSGNLSTIGYVMPNFQFTDGTGRMAKWTMTSTTSVTVNCYEDDGTNCADFDGLMTLTQY